MDFLSFDLSQASFEWDERKDQINFAKHGIHFKTAVKVFLDPNKLIREDEEHLEELRYDVFGDGRQSFVCRLCLQRRKRDQVDFRTYCYCRRESEVRIW